MTQHLFFILVFVSGFLSLLLVNLWSPYKRVKFRVDPKYGTNDPQFRRSIGALIGGELIPGNSIKILQNGDEIFPAMLAGIESAKSTITLESFIFWKGEIGQKFTDALCKKASEGVKVDMLIDWLGSQTFDDKYLDQLHRCNVDIHFYHPPRWYTLSRLNNRTHRKILVVDGTLGFIGGVGIADEWLGNGRQSGKWRDTHYEVRGPVVGQIQAAFCDNWIQSQEEVPHGDRYFPPIEPLTAPLPESYLVTAQMFKSSSDEGASSMRLLFLYSIAAARKTIDIASAYFVPDGYTVEQLIEARKRGVRIRIMVPGSRTDSRVTRKTSRAIWGDLLEHDIEFYEYLPCMFHNKLMVVDGVWTAIGSANFDARSFRINDEANLNVFDVTFAAAQKAIFETDIAHCRKLTYAGWLARPLYKRMSDYVFLLVRSQL